jgi:hypothetical protein
MTFGPRPFDPPLSSADDIRSGPGDWPAEVLRIELAGAADGEKQTAMSYEPGGRLVHPLLVFLHPWRSNYTFRNRRGPGMHSEWLGLPPARFPWPQQPASSFGFRPGHGGHRECRRLRVGADHRPARLAHSMPEKRSGKLRAGHRSRLRRRPLTGHLCRKRKPFAGLRLFICLKPGPS